MNEVANLSALEADTSLSNSCKSMGEVKEENLSSLVMNTSLSSLGIKRRKVKWLKKSYRQQEETSSENSLRCSRISMMMCSSAKYGMRRDCGHHYACHHVCRLAEGVGGLQACKGSLE